MAAHPGALPELPLVGQSQEDSGVDERGEGRVEVLLQVLLQQALVRKIFLKREKWVKFERNRPPDRFVYAT